MKIEGGEKTSSQWEFNPGHLAVALPVLYELTHNNQTITVALTITAQEVLNASIAHSAATQHVLNQKMRLYRGASSTAYLRPACFLQHTI